MLRFTCRLICKSVSTLDFQIVKTPLKTCKHLRVQFLCVRFLFVLPLEEQCFAEHGAWSLLGQHIQILLPFELPLLIQIQESLCALHCSNHRAGPRLAAKRGVLQFGIRFYCFCALWEQGWVPKQLLLAEPAIPYFFSSFGRQDWGNVVANINNYFYVQGLMLEGNLSVF